MTANLADLLRRREEIEMEIAVARAREAGLISQEPPCVALIPTLAPGNPSVSAFPKRPRRRPNF